MTEENGIHEVMADAIGPEPPIVGGPGRVFEQARRVRLRQRSVAGALSVVAVLGVAAGAVTLGRSGRPAAGTGTAATTVGAVVAATTSTTSTASVTVSGTAPAEPSTSATPATEPGKIAPTTSAPFTGTAPSCGLAPAAPTQGSGATLPMDARSSLELVKLLLPKSFTTSHYAGQDGEMPFGGMAMDDGHGRVGIGVNTRQFGIVESGTGCSLPDGSRLYLNSLNGDKPTAGGYASLGEYVRRIWPNGDSVCIQVFNYWPDWATLHPDHWVATTTRPTLPLSNDQLLAMAADGRWGTTVPAAFAQQARHDLVPYTAMGN